MAVGSGTHVRVVVAHGDGRVRASAADTLRARRSIDVVGTASSLAELTLVLETTWPDVLVLGEDLAGLHAGDVVGRVRDRWPVLPVLLLTSPGTDARTVANALRAGAALNLSAAVSPLKLVSMVVQTSSPAFVRELVERRQEMGGIPDLTAREADVLVALADGTGPRDVAAALGITERTLQTHLAHLLRKFAVEDLAALLDRADALRRQFWTAEPETPATAAS